MNLIPMGGRPGGSQAQVNLAGVEGSDAGPPGGYPPFHSNQPPEGPHAEPSTVGETSHLGSLVGPADPGRHTGPAASRLVRGLAPSSALMTLTRIKAPIRESPPRPLRPYAPMAFTGARGSFGWFDRGRRVERSARATREHKRWGATTRRGGGPPIAVRVADAVRLRTTRTGLYYSMVGRSGPRTPLPHCPVGARGRSGEQDPRGFWQRQGG